MATAPGRFSGRRSAAALTLMLLAALTSLSCSRSQQTTSTSESAGVARQPGAKGSRGASGSARVRVEQIVLGREMTADRRVITTGNETFEPADTVFASVTLAAPTPAAQLVGRWKAPDGTVVYESTETVQPSNEETAVTFHMVKPSGLRPGTYTLELLQGGQVVGTKQVTIVARMGS